MPVVTQGNHRFNVTIEPAGASDHHVFFEGLWDAYEAAGWTAVEHSDGTTVAAGRGATQNTNNAWKLYVNPGGTLWVRGQRGTASAQWRVFVDSTLPTGGSATVMPSHADSVQVLGTGGSYASLATDASTARAHCWANTEATPNAHVPFYWAIMSRGSTTSLTAFGVETLDQVADGTPGDADTADYVVWSVAGNTSNFTRAGGANKWRVWYRRGLSGALLDASSDVAWGLMGAGGNATFPGGVENADAYTGLYRKSRCWIGSARASAFQLPKGRGRFLRYPGPSTSVIGNFQRVDPATTEAYIRLQDFLLPWPQNTASPI